MAKISELDHEFASYAATEAGKLLLEIRDGSHNLSSSNLDSRGIRRHSVS